MWHATDIHHFVGGFRYHVQKDGFCSLYRGLAPVLFGSIPKAGIRFGGFDILKKKLADENGKASPLRNLAAGMGAGAIEATLVTTPVRHVSVYHYSSRSWIKKLQSFVDGNTQDEIN